LKTAGIIGGSGRERTDASAAGLTLALVLTASRAEAPQPQALPSPVKDKVCKLVNGRWFDGTVFSAGSSTPPEAC